MLIKIKALIHLLVPNVLLFSPSERLIKVNHLHGILKLVSHENAMTFTNKY